MATPALKTRLNTLRIPEEVAALLAALQVRDPDLSLLAKLSNEAWSRLLAFCNIAHLTLPLAQLPSGDLPRWVAEELQTILTNNALRFERIKATYREAADALDREGLEHIVIKGFTQAPDYVAKPSLRSQSDIDLVCLPQDIEFARKALFAIGYKSDERNDSSHADHIPPLVRLGEWTWRGNPYDPEMPVGIELHFCFWNQRISRICIPEVEFFWERQTTRSFDNFSFRCLDRIDHLGHLALHILRNLFLHEWIVHHVYELATFLHARANDDAFWQSWTEMHSSSLRSLEAIAFHHARAWFNCDLHALATREIDSLPAAQLNWLDRFSNSGLDVMFRQNKDSLWLQLSLISSRRDQWEIFKETILPRQVAPMKSPRVQVRNKRLAQSSKNHPWQQYISYLVSRSTSHGRASVVTLCRGLRWYIAQQRLAPQS